MWSAIVGLGASVVNSVVTFFSSKAVKTGTKITIFIGLLAIIPFTIKLPDGFVEVFSTNGGFYDILCQLNYFAPVPFLCLCLVLVLSFKYARVFLDIIFRIFEWFLNW